MTSWVPEPQPRTHYTNPDKVAETLGLSDPSDPMSLFKFSDSSNPSYEFVEDLILSAEDEIDLRTRRTWRENYVKDYVVTVSGYMSDENSAGRPWYYSSGGYEITLRKNLLPWDPSKGDRV